MAQKKVKTRIQNKSDTIANWSTANTNGFIPLKGELILYQNTESVAGLGLGGKQPLIKIGDGSSKVEQLSFLNIDTITDFEPVCFNNNNLYIRETQTGLHTSNAPYYLVSLYLYAPMESSESALVNLPNNVHIKSTFMLVFDGVTTTRYGRTFPVQLGFTHRSQDTVNLFVHPDKCLRSQWTLADTVSNAGQEFIITSDSNNSKVEFTVTLPEDKDGQGNYLYNTGFATVDIDLYKVTNELIYITVTPKLCVGN